ncbi:MAG: endonuclease/exonuclease/phosphatase family protein [Candidatus Cryptobacteroides sp.]
MKRLLITLLILTPFVLAALYVFLLNNRPGESGTVPARQEQELRVGALNINWLGFNGNASMTTETLVASARANDLDIILLQEYKEHWDLDEKAFKAFFKKDYKHVSIEGECACISRYPITSHKRVKFDDFSDNFSDIKVKLPGGQVVEIFAVHLITTGINNFAGANAPQAMAGMEATYTFFGNGNIRKNQAVSLANRIRNVECPLIVAGDFNCVPASAPYRELISASMKDSFFEAGHGKGATYRGLGDFFRIDYIFYGSGLECTDCRIVDDGISDHRMVMASFVPGVEDEAE